MIDNIPLPALLSILITLCVLVVIIAVWLLMLVSKAETKQVNLAGFGVSILIDTRTRGRRATDRTDEK